MQRSGQTRAAANPFGSALNMTDDAPDCVDGNQQIALQGPPLTISVPLPTGPDPITTAVWAGRCGCCGHQAKSSRGSLVLHVSRIKPSRRLPRDHSWEAGAGHLPNKVAAVDNLY